MRSCARTQVAAEDALCRRARAKSFEAREFMSVACSDAGEHRQLVLDRWLQVGRIAQVLVSWPPPLMVRDSK